ncbi:ATP-binding protein [Planctomycetota bacterium]
MAAAKDKRKTILLHFLMGVGLPSLLLGYLAFRGIQKDVALLETERFNAHSAIAQQVVDSVDQQLADIEKAFADCITQSPEVKFTEDLKRLKEKHTLIEAIFQLDKDLHIQLPFSPLLYLPDGSSRTLIPPSVPDSLTVGQDYEFKHNQLEEALASYQEAWARSSDRYTKGVALHACGRVQQKLNDWSEAARTYRTIAKDYRDIKGVSGLPLGLVAQRELADVFVTLNDPNNAVQTLMGLYKDIIQGDWSLEASQYDYYLDDIDRWVGNILSQHASLAGYSETYQVLKAAEKKQRVITQRLMAFRVNAVPNLQTKLLRSGNSPVEMSNRFTLDIGEHVYLISMLFDGAPSSNPSGETWGVLFNSDQLKTDVLRPAALAAVSSEGIDWVIKERNGQTVLQSEYQQSGPAMTVSTGFPDGVPPWSLELYQLSPSVWDTLLTSRSGINLIILILLIGTLVLSLTLTMRIVSREFELSRMKSDFVSTVSHEFKSPLTSIRQLAEMLKTGRVRSQEHRDRYYSVLLDQSERLSLLVDNILDFAKMEEGKRQFDFEQTDLGPFLNELVAEFQQRVRHEDVTCKTHIDPALPPIRVDRVAMNQALFNLMDNAVKYSGSGKEIRIQAEKEPHQVIISIQDFGSGIQAEDIDKIFDRFYRGGNELTRTVKGSGLGLTLVKQIVEAHGGVVQVQSEPGQGSTFLIKLPIPTREVR